MKRSITAIAVAAALAVTLAAAGSATGSGAAGATVGTSTSRLGRILVDGRGRTLYLFENDEGRASTCYGACASIWPPFTTSGKPHAAREAHVGLLGTTRRKGGKLEVTYAGHPLYLYAGDQKRGDTNGEGLNQFGVKWYALAPSGKKIDRH